MSYLLDANVFIEAKNRHYGFDFCPAFWDWLIDRNGAGIVFSVAEVGDELTRGKDELADWATVRGSDFFLDPPDPGMTPALASVSAWVVNKGYVTAAVNAFLGDPDYYLISHALAENLVVVTHEVASTSLKKIKIPDVCKGVGVEPISPFDMLRREGARFRLGA